MQRMVMRRHALEMGAGRERNRSVKKSRATSWQWSRLIAEHGLALGKKPDFKLA
jgi:hypothetical protein